MATQGKEDSVGEHAGKDRSIGGRIPITPPILTDDVHSAVSATSDAIRQIPQSQGWELRDVKDTLPNVAENQLKSPKMDQITFPDISIASEPSEARQRQLQSQSLERQASVVACPSSDYFVSTTPQNSQGSGLALTASSPKPVPVSDNGPTPWDSSTPASPSGGPSMSKEFSAQNVVGTTFNPSTTRPTSVPNFQSRPLSHRREGPDYPNYPDQSFRALQDQHYPPPYRPVSSRSLRTRSSHPSQNLSYSSSDVQPMGELPQVTSGAKTVGNTPAQSPGLFSPLFPVKKPWSGDSDDGLTSTPMLHPTHHKAPRETHKLLKDIDPISGRKLINRYEILQKLGSGQHGTVKQGRDLDSGNMVAVKIVRRFSKKLRLGRTRDPNDMIKKEVAILKKARHPHIVSLIEVIDDDEFGKVYLVLEYVERGEIIWRKQTDKDIALFEIARTKREIADNINEDFERTAIAEFNSGAPSRRLEKARVLEKQKRQAKERFGARAQGIPSYGQQANSGSFWSLEFEHDLENESDVEHLDQSEVERESIIRWAGNAMTTEGSLSSDSPSHTPKPPPRPARSDLVPRSVPTSRPDTPAKLEGTMWGPNLEDNFSDLALQSTLDEIICGQTQWNPDEEDFRYVPCLTQSQALDAFRDTVLGLEYLHYQGIIHRDIKPANLLWTHDYRVKISDFGVSYLGKPIREDHNKEEIPEADAAILDEALELAKTVGTPAFYAPELCDPQYFEDGKHPERPAITGQIDVWALGVTLYGMIFGRLPFFHHNEFQMYERIAREEAFIPRMRLRGVEHTDKTPSNHNKRLDDVLEYEEVDDELRDLLKRLLEKEPSKRITLREVKHHPWVLRGLSDQMSWMDETDPSLQSQGRKIEVSTQEVQDAVVELTLVDRVKAGFQRATSILRGRNPRKRAESNPKNFESKTPDSPSSTTTVGSRHENDNSPASVKDGRRPSLRGDEQIFTALRASRESSEHPLAQSVAASPEVESDISYFNEGKPPRPVSDPQATRRPTLPDRTLSTADSMKTIRAHAPANVSATAPPNTQPSGEEFSSIMAVTDPSTGSSSLGGIFGGAGRRFASTMRSRERGMGRHSPAQSSRSSSVDNKVEDPHASPSLAISSAIAAGHVDQPPALREEPETAPRLPNTSPSKAFQRAEENNRRRTIEYTQLGRRPTVSTAADVACPPSPDDETFFAQQRPASAADSTAAFQISSSSDQIVSGESTPHSRIPSVVSGASSLSAAVEERDDPHAFRLEKSISPITIGRRSGSHSREQQPDDALHTATPALNKAAERVAAEDEAGYNGEGEQDSDSEDEGLAMA